MRGSDPANLTKTNHPYLLIIAKRGYTSTGIACQ